MKLVIQSKRNLVVFGVFFLVLFLFFSKQKPLRGEEPDDKAHTMAAAAASEKADFSNLMFGYFDEGGD
ncbi:hypothetical protein HY745_10675, partial [Candidatus Desantisbacteria bacterium]|nr:hypothetical protein [Candidatus Desantisbacteria bacterium]